MKYCLNLQNSLNKQIQDAQQVIDNNLKISKTELSSEALDQARDKQIITFYGGS